MAAGPRLTAWARDRGWRAGQPVEQGTGVELAADARAGDAVATTAVRRAGTALGVVIASVVVLCDLEVVAVGGGLSEAWDVLSPALTETLERHMALAYAQEVRVVPTALGATRGLIGAAALHLCGDTYWPGARLSRRAGTTERSAVAVRCRGCRRGRRRPVAAPRCPGPPSGGSQRSRVR